MRSNGQTERHSHLQAETAEYRKSGANPGISGYRRSLRETNARQAVGLGAIREVMPLPKDDRLRGGFIGFAAAQEARRIQTEEFTPSSCGSCRIGGAKLNSFGDIPHAWID